MKERMAKGAEANKEFYAAPSTKAIAPFRIADDLYYVGDKKVCAHLIRTDEGLILIDAGFPCATHLLIDAIWRLGFDPKDVRWILLTHGHFDHYGAANEFRRLYGTKTALSAVDAAALREFPARGHGFAAHTEYIEEPVIDRELADGEVFSFGGREIRCVLTPGHTMGVMTFFFDVTDNGNTYLAGLFGGAGPSHMTLAAMKFDRYPLDMPQRMLASLDRIEKEPVTVHLGNHPGNNKTLQKREQQLKEGGNPFIDPGSWNRQLSALREKTLSIIRENAETAKRYE
jgi:metallo-beta-lactamase class B